MSELSAPTPTATHPMLFSQKIAKLWLRLSEPAVRSANVDIRQQRLLAQITLLLGIIGALAAILYAVFVILGIIPVGLLFVNTLVTCMMLPIYLLNYHGHYRAAALWLVYAIVTAIGLVVTILPSGTLSNDLVSFISISIPLTNILLTRRDVIKVTFTSIVVITFVTIAGYILVETALFTIILVIFVAAIGIIYDFHRTTLETKRRARLLTLNQALQHSQLALESVNAGLEQKVTERTAELIRAAKEAERANYVKSAFLASMSHELRTPLNAIINFTRFVAKGAQGPVNEKQLHTLNEVVSSSRHLLGLINDILDMAKIESGSLNLFVEEDVQLGLMVENVVSTAKILLDSKPVTLEVDLPAELPTIRADRQRILQVLLNIMSNACRFTEQGKITLKVERHHDEILFSIQDTGTGIPPEDHTSVFEAFKQTESGLRQSGGTGLGMPISKFLIEAHGGQIWLESIPNVGSTFYVRLPIQSAALESSVVKF